MDTAANMDETPILKPRKAPPLVMPKSPEDMFVFLSHGEPYEGESDEDFNDRTATLDNLLASMNRQQEVLQKKKYDPPLIDRLIKRL